MIVFAYPKLFLLLFLPFLFYQLMPIAKGLHGDALKVPFLDDLKRIALSSGGLWQQAGEKTFLSKRFWLLYLVWTTLCLAAARPQIVGEPRRLQSESRDIMLVLDLSTSMLETDFSYQGQHMTRLDAVKKVVADFTKQRADDRFGLILFGTRAYLQAPLTFDKASVRQILYTMQAGMAGQSTSIGDALALALKNLTLSDDKNEKVIILLTDGESNDGSMSLGQAINMAAKEGIKTYTIGVGSPHVFFKMLSLSSGIDEQSLKLLAKATKGQYFKAENMADLQKVYQMIDTLEPSVHDERYVRDIKELYWLPLLTAVGLVLVGWLIMEQKQ